MCVCVCVCVCVGRKKAAPTQARLSVATAGGIRNVSSAAAHHNHVHCCFAPDVSCLHLQVLVQPGQEVKEGDTLLVMEAMKMEVRPRANAFVSLSVCLPACH